MENAQNKKAYSLSIKEVIKILVVYYLIIGSLVQLPLDIVLDVVTRLSKNSLAKEMIFCANDIIGNFAIVMIILKYVRKKGAEKLKFRDNLNIKLLVSVIFIFLGYRVFSANSIDILISKIPVDDSITQTFNLMTENTVLGFISIAIVAPIAEEIVMRGIILEGLLQKYSPCVAIIVSSLVFGIAHMNIPQFINAFLIGIILAIVYFKTRSLILTMVGHACNNIMVFIEIPSSILLLVAGLIVLVIAAFIFIKQTNNNLKTKENSSLQI